MEYNLTADVYIAFDGAHLDSTLFRFFRLHDCGDACILLLLLKE